MNAELVNINLIKVNPKNPRVIRDDKFKILVKSILDYPDMLKLRPIVVDENMMVLGGNMRLKACREAGIEKVWIHKVENLDDEGRRKFLIKDNVNYGRWDYMLLQDTDSLKEWGMDLPDWVGTNLDSDDDDFFDQDFLDEMADENNNTQEAPPTNNNLTSNTAFVLLMLEAADYEFVKKIENKLLNITGTDNISDAVLNIIKKHNNL